MCIVHLTDTDSTFQATCRNRFASAVLTLFELDRNICSFICCLMSWIITAVLVHHLFCWLKEGFRCGSSLPLPRFFKWSSSIMFLFSYYFDFLCVQRCLHFTCCFFDSSCVYLLFSYFIFLRTTKILAEIQLYW